MQSKPKKEKTLINLSDVDVVKCIDTNTPLEEKKAIIKIVYTLKVKQHWELKQRLQQVLKENNLGLQPLLEQFRTLMEFFKESQVITPIVQLFYQKYKENLLKMGGDPDLFLPIWKSIPLTHLQDFIRSFHLGDIIEALDKAELYSTVRQLLVRNKNKEAALYCYVFKLDNQQFLVKEVLPRLLQGQDLYTSYVVQLLKSSAVLLSSIVQDIDPVAGIRMVQVVREDMTKFPKLIRHLQQENYNHCVNEFKDWFKCEEIMSHCPLFLQWYANNFLKGQRGDSLLVRHGLKSGVETCKNPLYDQDDFIYSQAIVGKQNGKEFWSLQNLGIQESDVVFVSDDESKQFEMASQVLLSAQVVGFDSEFVAKSHKFQGEGVSIIQLSANKKVFIIDFIKLSLSEKTLSFLKELFEATHIVKVGHSLKCDFLYLSKSNLVSSQGFNSFVDIMELFKAKYPQESQSSLSHIVLALTGVQLSKYQQRSNWNKRPLRRAQTHYAALDAYICEVILQKLNGATTLSHLQLDKAEKNSGSLLVVEGWLSFGPEYGHFLEKPKFLVDNMLKRLSTYLRNLGMDAEYLSVRDFGVAISIASNQQRVILTKDKHLKNKKNIRVPVYLIQCDESESMTKEVVIAFKIDLEHYSLLSRCVKCNNGELILADWDTAIEKLNFKHKDCAIKEFWLCSKCDQYYWEGHSYQNSKKRFAAFM